MSEKFAASRSFKSLLRVKHIARTLLLSASILTFGATALFAQVGVQVQEPVNIPAPPKIITTGPDTDKEVVQKRWDAILQTPVVKDANADKSKGAEAAKAADAPK